MAEKIGLEGYFDLKNFDSGVSKYISRTKEAEGATDKAAGSLAKGWDQMGKSVLNATGIMGKALVGATAAATAAVGAFVVSGIKGAATLEAQLSTVASVLGVTTEAVGPLKEAVYDLALNPNLKVGVDEAAAAMEMLARNGLSMDQILGGAAEATVLLANATKADFATAADIGTDAMAIFGIEAKDMMQAVDGIVSVTNNSKFSINDYALALAQGAGVAAAVGVEFEDFNTTIAAISPLFKSGSDAGTSLKTMLQRLIPQSSDAAEAMDDLGLTTVGTQSALEYLAGKGVKPVSGDMWELFNQVVGVYYAANDLEMGSEEAAKKFNKWATETGLLQSAFFDQNGQMKDMNDIAAILNGSLSGLSEMEKNAALSTIFGTDAMRAAVALADSGEVVYTDLAKASEELGLSQDELREYIEGGITAFEIQQAKMRQTDALQNAKTNTDNFQSALSMLTDTIDAISRRIGDLFLPMLKNLALGLNDMVGAAGPAIIQFFDDMLNGLMAVGNYFAIVIQDGDALNDWLTHLPDGMRGTVQFIGETIAGIAQTLTAFREGTLGADYPWFEVFPPSIAPVAMLLAGAIQFVSQNMEAFKGAIAGVGALLASAAISQILTGIAAAIAAINLPLVALIASAALVGAAWNANWFGIRDTTLEVLAALQAAFGPLLDTIMQFGGEALTEIMAFVQGTGTEFSALTTITQAIGAAFVELFNGIGPAAMVAVGAIRDWAVQIGGAIADNYPAIVAGVYSYGVALVEWIAAAAPLAIVAIGDYIAGLITWLAGDGQSQIAASTGPLVTALLEWITNDLIPQVGPAMASFGLALGSAILEIAKALGTAALAIGVAIINAILGTDWASTGGAVLVLLQAGFESAKGGIIAAALEVGTRLRAAFEGIDWAAVGATILSLLTNGLSGGKALLVATVTTIATTLRTAFEGIDWAATGQAILDGIKAGIERARSLLTETATAIIQGLRTAFLSSGVNWGDIGQTVINGIRTGLEAAKGALETAANSVATALKDYFSENRQGWTESGRGIMANLRTGFESAKTAFLDAISNIAAAAKAAFESVDWAAVGRELLLAVGRGIGASVGLFVLGIAAIVEVARQAFLVDWQGVGESILTGIRAGVDTAKAAFLAFFGEIATDASTTFTAIDWKALGSLILNSIQVGIGLVKQGFIDGVNLVAGDVLKQFTDIKWAELGQNIITLITGGITKAANGLVTAASEIATNALNAFRDIDWAGVGKAIIDGIISGINSAGGALSDKLTSLAEEAWEAVKDTLGIDSPSKVFAEIGRNIIEGLIVGIDDRVGALEGRLKDLSNFMANTSFAFGDYRNFKEFAGVMKDIADLTGSDPLVADFLDSQAQELDARKRILDLFAKLGSDKFRVLGQSFMGTSLTDLMKALQSAANATLADARSNLEAEARKLSNAIKLDGVMATLQDQAKRLQAVAAVTFTGFFETAADKLKGQIANLDKQISGAREFFILTGSPQAEAQVADLIKQRAVVVAQLADIARQQQGTNLLGGDVAGYTAALQDQLKLVQEMQKLGISTAGMSPFASAADVTPQALANLGVIEAVVARKQAEALRKQIAEALFIGDLGSAGNGLTGPAAIYKTKVLDPIMAQLRASVLNEAERVRLIAKYNEEARKAQAIQAQQNLVDKLAAQLGGNLPALGQRYQTQVLDPILAKLREQVLTEAERNRLSEEYRKGQEKLLQLQREQSKLDFLKEQLDLIKLVKDNELDASWVFQGLTLGINASISDLLAATTRAVQAMIAQVQGDLRIASPSKVFMDIGKQVMAGLARGIDSNVVRPMSSLQRAIEVPRGSVSNRSLNLSFGGVTISNGMDLATFETRVQRIMESSLA